jgi:tetratricopeptide (TPR) repeat protein
MNTRHPNSTTPRPGVRWVVVFLLAVALVALGVAIFWPWGTTPDRREEGLRLAGQGRLEEAEPLLVAAAERNPDDADVVAALAVAKLGGPDAAAAERYLSRWCDLRPAEARPFQLRMDLRHRVARGRASRADRLRDQEAALADGRRVLELDPANDSVRREVAWLALQVDQFAVAEAECRRSLSAAPADGWLTYLLAKTLHAQGKREEAATALDPFVRAQPNSPDALLLRGVLYVDADQPGRAIPLLRQALTMKGVPRRDCLYRLGLALAADGQAEESQKVFAEVELLNLTGAVANDSFPNNPAMRVQIAEAMLGMGRLPEANAELDAVLATAPDFPPAHRVKAAYFERTGQPEKASEHRRRAGAEAP